MELRPFGRSFFLLSFMLNFTRFPILLLLLAFVACQSNTSEAEYTADVDPNPAAEGFNLEDSDSLAIAWADGVMLAMGGRKTWDETRFLQWNFFGSRKWFWDKKTGDIRVEAASDTTIILYNLQSKHTQVYKYGQTWSDPDTLEYYGERARKAWINDSYWLFMPFKLKDSGVTLSYLGLDTLAETMPATKLRLEFEGVGVTPNNAYDVWIDQADTLIKKWAFYNNATDSLAQFDTPWVEYKNYNGLYLASSRGAEYEIGEIATYSELDSTVFRSFDPLFYLNK